MTRKIARFVVSPPFIVELLHLPSDARILGSKDRVDGVEIVVEHDGLDEVPQGDPIPLVAPMLTSENGEVKFSHWYK